MFPFIILNTLHLTMILRYVNDFVAPTAQTKEVFAPPKKTKKQKFSFVLLIPYTDDLKKKNCLAMHLLLDLGFWLCGFGGGGRGGPVYNTLPRSIELFALGYEKIRRPTVCNPSFKKQSTNPI